jgi:hypothetical protein
MCHFSRILASQSLGENENIKRAWENTKYGVEISDKSSEAAYKEWVDKKCSKLLDQRNQNIL